MITKLADFYAIPYSRNANYEILLSRVSYVMRECRTELVIIDDIHRLDLHYRGNEQVADALKELSERCPGTMVYAGVDVARDDDAQRHPGVGHHVQIGAAYVQILVLVLHEQQGRTQVDDEADARHHHHRD